jgi:hypothetical protein
MSVVEILAGAFTKNAEGNYIAWKEVLRRL